MNAQNNYIMLTHNKLSSIVIFIMDFFIINYFIKK